MYTKSSNHRYKSFFAIMLAAVMCVTALPLLGSSYKSYAAAPSASGKISSDDVIMRGSTSTSGKVIATLKKNTAVSISGEVFTTTTSTAAKDRWYQVSANGKSGYVRADLVTGVSFGSGQAARTTDALNYRTGPATTFQKLGTIGAGTSVTLLLPAARSGKSDQWYKAKVNGTNAYICGSYVTTAETVNVDLTGKSDLAKSLLTNPTSGGKARVVYTFTKNNCRKLFSIKGHSAAKVPQGFTFTGSEYYILYGMSAGQAIVTYSADGKRVRASKFAFSIGHPNGITYDPVTRMCYIFKGNTKKIFTWNPATNQFGKASTPYSSSGVGYDNVSNMLYASSKTGIRAYSADGAFVHQRLFPRCNHGFFHYIQDCGAGEGFIFHGISGKKKKKTNYLDIYRAADCSYLGSIKITIGEYESAVVGNDGYLQLLINTDGKTDYVWKTPLNVRELN